MTVAWFMIRGHTVDLKIRFLNQKITCIVFLIVQVFSLCFLMHGKLLLSVLIAAQSVSLCIESDHLFVFLPFECDNSGPFKVSLYFYTVLAVHSCYSRQSNIYVQ